jgi:hypothetical protein
LGEKIDAKNPIPISHHPVGVIFVYEVDGRNAPTVYKNSGFNRTSLL